MEQRTGSKLEKKYEKAIYCHPAYLTYMRSTSCEMLAWMKHKLESRLLGEISITSDMQMIPPFWQKSKRNKETLDEFERGEWKIWLKTQHSKNQDRCTWAHNLMPNKWRNRLNSGRFYFLGLQNHCGWWLQHEIKTLSPWKKSYGKPRQYIKKQWYHFAYKDPYSQSYGFSSSHIWM